MSHQTMSEEIIINCAPVETRAAILDSGVMQELFIEREHHRGRVGGIFCGKVVRVLPGMQAAFVDIGFERAAFIHAKDMFLPSVADEMVEEEPEENDTAEHVLAPRSLELATSEGMVSTISEPSHTDATPGKDAQSSAAQEGAHQHSSRERYSVDIRELVTEGQSLVVQVVKDQIGSKGARLTTHLSIPSRYLVLMPLVNHVGVSQRIEDEEERERLKGIIEECRTHTKSLSHNALPGIILRTAAEGASKEALSHDFSFLVKLWEDLKPRIASAKPGQALLEDSPLYLRVLRDMLRPQVERVRVDSRTVYEKLKAFASQFLPDFVDRIEYYSGARPLFDLYNLEEEIKRALEREVRLKSGGSVVFDQTEAMTTVDVNTGAFVGSQNLDETIYKTNLEAAQAIARQLRLRNLGGIIIVDFIDMKHEEHGRQVMRTFEKALEKDHVKTNITTLSELGLLEMTRKRTRESLEQILCHPCPVCSGRGTLRTPETICFEIYRELIREARQYNAQGYLVIAAQAVVDRLLDEESANVAELADYLGANIRIQVESLYHVEQFDVVLG